MNRWRPLVFAAVCLVAAGIAIGYVTLASRATTTDRSRAETRPLERVDTSRAGILFLSALGDDTFHKVAYVPLDAITGPWSVGAMTCERAYFRGDRGACLTMDDGVLPSFGATIFDAQLRPGHTRRLTGPPSRTRVSPDGRRAAFTVFESGHSYADTGFSTRTTLIDMASGASIADLEEFVVSRNGERFAAQDFNYWGVSFAGDSNRFYATLRSGGTNYLIEGNVDTRSARVMSEGVECPSLSDDQRYLAFKKRESSVSGGIWRIAILDLETMQERVLDEERRSVDDQVEWLDDTHVLYFLPGTDGNNIWSLRTDQPEAPRVLIRGGYSPAVLRPAVR